MIAIHRLVGALAFAVCALVSVDGHGAQPRDSDVKAAYLFNFSRFTKWPAAATSGDAFSVCILGRDPFGNALDGIVSGETIDGKRVAIRRIGRVQDASGCRIVFVSASEEANIPHILQTLDGSPALTVSDLAQFLDRGGMIQLVNDGKRIRFTINLSAAERAGLSFSSELLRVAIVVRNAKPEA